MSFEVRDGVMWQSRMVKSTGRARWTPIAPVDKAVADALNVLRAAWGPDAVATERGAAYYTDDVPQGPEGERTVVRSPWRKVDGADDGEDIATPGVSDRRRLSVGHQPHESDCNEYCYEPGDGADDGK